MSEGFTATLNPIEEVRTASKSMLKVDSVGVVIALASHRVTSVKGHKNTSNQHQSTSFNKSAATTRTKHTRSTSLNQGGLNTRFNENQSTTSLKEGATTTGSEQTQGNFLYKGTITSIAARGVAFASSGMISECSNFWSIAGFVITSSYTGISVTFALTGNWIFPLFYGWMALPLCVTAMAVS